MELIQTLGYALCALGYLSIAFLLLTTPKFHFIKKNFLVFGVITALWAVLYLYFNMTDDSVVLFIPVNEAFKNVAWLLLLTSILNSESDRFIANLKHKFFFFPSAVFICAPLVLPYLPISIGAKYQIILLNSIIAALLQLILVEQLYRKSGEVREAYKPLVIAVGSISTFDFFIFSESLLVQSIDEKYLAARSYVYLLAIPFIILTIRRVKSWNLRIYVSRDVVLQSSLLFMAGIYLTLMAAAGYFIKNIGGTWSGVIQIVFSCAAILFLLSVFISDSFRKSSKAFITKHFFANQFDYRQEWLKLTKTLTIASDKNVSTYDLGLKGMIEAVNYDAGAYFKHSVGKLELLANSKTNLSDAACQQLMGLLPELESSHWLFDLEDLQSPNSEYVGQHVEVSALLNDKIQLVIPVFVGARLEGVFILSSLSPDRAKLNWEVRDYLNVITAQISSYFNFFEASNSLAENAQFAAFNRMSAFVVHDLKNVVAQINLIIQNSQHHKHNPEFIDDTFQTLEHTRERMDKMLNLLMNKQVETENKQETNIIKLVNDVLGSKYTDDQLTRNYDSSQQLLLSLETERLSHVIVHLVDNALQACENKGKVTVHVEQTATTVAINIIDSGVGMSKEFIKSRLFKPFDTTKGNSGMGIGVYDAKMFAESHHGKLIVKSELGKGTTMTLSLPKG